MNELSSKAYAWLMATLIVLLLLALVLWRAWAYLPVIGHYALIVLGIVAFVGLLVVLYRVWHKLMLDHYERVDRLQRLQLEADDRRAAREREADKIELDRDRVRLQQMHEANEHQRLQAAARTVLLPPGHTAVFPDHGYYRVEGLPAPSSASATRQQQQGSREQIAQHSGADAPTMPDLGAREQVVVTEEKPEEIPVPIAPTFWQMVHLITSERMPLCFVVDTDPRSRTYGQTIPAYGTILDLLSLCIIGKPGRGKSVLLLFYICCLAQYGAEMHVLDPQGAFKELQLLHGRALPAMPPTARIYYYSNLGEMELAVTNVLAEIKEREELYKPHLEDGEVQFHTVKHPLVILADELPIIAEMDVEIKQKTKEENKARKEEGLEAQEIRQVTTLVKMAVLAARKYGVYFVGASQSIDATILPTRVSAGFNSRIVFSSSEQKARMAGLESDVAKRLLPVIRRAGPGKVIYDCGRWETPLVGAVPNMTIEDVLRFFGITMEELRELWALELGAQARVQRESVEVEATTVRTTGPLDTPRALPQIVPARAGRRATLADAIAVWNEAAEQGHEIGRPRLREVLQARGFECSDDLSKSLLKAIKQQLESAGDAGGA